MKTFAIIQARMGSTRLPGKILLDIGPGVSVLDCMLARVAACKEIDTTIIATTTNEKDQVLVDYLTERNIPQYVGSEEDVLDRYYQAAKAHGAKEGDVIVRMTSDCPLIDPKVADTTVRFFKDGDYDYASNNLEPYTYADGMDTEVFSFETLERAWKEAVTPAHREHVTFYMWKNPDIFKIGQYVNPKEGQQAYRLTLDYQEDLDVLSDVYTHLYPTNPLFTMEDILFYLDEHPEIKKINTDVERNASWKAA
jgi:spore coat polysaccharide biosynthesis protein SpsF